MSNRKTLSIVTALILGVLLGVTRMVTSSGDVDENIARMGPERVDREGGSSLADVRSPGGGEGVEGGSGRDGAARINAIRIVDRNTGAPLRAATVCCLDADGVRIGPPEETSPDGWLDIPARTVTIAPLDGWSFEPVAPRSDNGEVQVDGKFELVLRGQASPVAWLLRNPSWIELSQALAAAERSLELGETEGLPMGSSGVVEAEVSYHSTASEELVIIAPQFEVSPGHPKWAGSVVPLGNGSNRISMPSGTGDCRAGKPFVPKFGSTHEFQVRELAPKTNVTLYLDAETESFARTSLMSLRSPEGQRSTIRGVVDSRFLSEGTKVVTYDDVSEGHCEVTTAILRERVLSLSSHSFIAEGGDVALTELTGKGPYRLSITDGADWRLASIVTRSANRRDSSNVQILLDVGEQLAIDGIPYQMASLFFVPAGATEGMPAKVMVDLATTFELSIGDLEE